MLDFVVVFTKGGVVLWNSKSNGSPSTTSESTFSSCINGLIRGVILEVSGGLTIDSVAPK